MTFWQKIKQTLRSFMNGRYGGDEFSKVLMWAGLIVYLLGAFAGVGLLMLLGMALYAYTIFRIFSRNIEKRREENRRYLTFRDSLRTRRGQAQARWKNRKEYRYFRCPKCHSWLRLPRKVGEVTVTCGRCQNKFSQRA